MRESESVPRFDGIVVHRSVLVRMLDILRELHAFDTTVNSYLTGTGESHITSENVYSLLMDVEGLL